MAVSERNDGAVVFVRHFNDVDHIGPVAIAASKAMPVRLIITHTDARAHPLVGVLPTVSSVEVRDLAELLGTATEAAARSGVEGGDLEPALLFDGVSDNPVVALDWDYSEFAGRVCDAARNLGLTTVSLPHGDAPYINLLINLDDIDGGLARHYERATRYDHTVVPNSRCAIRYPFLSPERLHVLGSPRYNDAWRRELERLAPATPHRSESEGRRIAFLLRNANFPIHWEEVMRALAMIADSGPVDVAVKHHTRDKMMDTVLDAHPRLRPGRHGAIDVVDKGVASRALLGWAELVIDLGTSIAFEAVLDAVPVVSLEYVHANRSTVAAQPPGVGSAVPRRPRSRASPPTRGQGARLHRPR